MANQSLTEYGLEKRNMKPGSLSTNFLSASPFAGQASLHGLLFHVILVDFVDLEAPWIPQITWTPLTAIKTLFFIKLGTNSKIHKLLVIFVKRDKCKNNAPQQKKRIQVTDKFNKFQNERSVLKQIPCWISKIIFVLGSFEFLAMLEGKTREGSFFQGSIW